MEHNCTLFSRGSLPGPAHPPDLTTSESIRPPWTASKAEPLARVGACCVQCMRSSFLLSTIPGRLMRFHALYFDFSASQLIFRSFQFPVPSRIQKCGLACFLPASPQHSTWPCVPSLGDIRGLVDVMFTQLLFPVLAVLLLFDSRPGELVGLQQEHG